MWLVSDYYINTRRPCVDTYVAPCIAHVESDEKLMWGVNESSYPHFWLIGFGKERAHTQSDAADALQITPIGCSTAAFVDNIVGVHTKPVKYASQINGKILNSSSAFHMAVYSQQWLINRKKRGAG